ncbi:MAG: hypothetical protein QOF48_2713 [Verrucomicrobiota bacterium]|jgi:lipoprotein-anchoring transpeptidase ErfK/SrfK
MTFPAAPILPKRIEGWLTSRRVQLFAGILVVILGYRCWHSARAQRQSTNVGAATALPFDATNGVLVIPVTNKSGLAAEPMILVPVNGAAAWRATRTNDAPALGPGTGATTNLSMPRAPDLPNFDEKTFAAQVALARRVISSGSIDGVMGSQTRAALRVFQRRESLPLTGLLDQATVERLQPQPPLLTNYVITTNDLMRLLPVGATWLAKSAQERLDFETVTEMLAERTQSNPRLLMALNAAVDWNRLTAGTRLKIPVFAYPEPERKAAFVRISIGERSLQAFDAETNLLGHFPCSIASKVEKRPVGEELHVSVIAPNPNYTFDPEVFPESAEARELGRKLILPPGPNNPVGVAWIGLDKPGYGMHGTPKPEDVGRTESHGCFRLANWNAEYLLKLVTLGMPVFIDP